MPLSAAMCFCWLVLSTKAPTARALERVMNGASATTHQAVIHGSSKLAPVTSSVIPPSSQEMTSSVRLRHDGSRLHGNSLRQRQ